MAVAEVVELLACPHCRQALALTPDGATLRCPQGHSFDVARQGYVNLQSSKPPRNADTAAMVAARDRFLSAGHYRPIADRLVELASLGGVADPTLLEVGAGTGYYLARLLTDLPGSRGVALDVSVAAARRAAGAHPRLGSVVADVWQPLPVRDSSVDLVLDVFAPRNAAEFSRVLRSSGRLLTVTPEAEHLAEARRRLGLLDIQPAKHEQLRVALAGHLTETAREPVVFSVKLDAGALRDLVAMGPNAFHTEEAALSTLVASVPTPLTVTVAVNLSTWAPTGRS